MSEETEPKSIRDVEVTCSGPDGSPHAPRRLALPARVTVTCDKCGQRYRRAPDWNNLTRANWPKAE